jgi:hypothetical protein
MLEVCERFPAIGTIETYMALSSGARAIYNQYTLLKIEAETRAKWPLNSGRSRD